MRTALFILSLLISCTLNAQHLDNRLDAGLIGGKLFPVAKQEVFIGDFRYPSLYGNYSPVFTGGVYCEYRVMTHLWLGLDYRINRLKDWKGDPGLFILADPEVVNHLLAMTIAYSPELSRTKGSRIRWTLHLDPIFSVEYLEWHPDPAYNPAYIENTVYLMPGIRAGTSFRYALNLYTGIKADASFTVLPEDSFYHFDRSFHSLSVTLGFYFRLMKNPYYRYE
ncbi:MAG: hypothetical protein ACOYXB_16715 [Bacteroidota bacterium]